MTFVIADRVQETTATTGTATTLNLAGASPAFQSFVSGVGSGNTCNVCILSGDNTSWEVILGALVTSGSPNTLTISAANVSAGSSGAGVLISLTGTSTIFLTEPAALLRNIGSVPLIVAPPVAASWTQRNFAGTTSLVDVANGVRMSDSSTVASHIVRGMTLVSPAPPYTIDVNLCIFPFVVSAAFLQFAVGWTDGTKVQGEGVTITGNSGNYGNAAVNWWSNYTTFASGAGGNYGLYNLANCWVRVADDGVNVSFGISADGINYFTNYSIAKASGFLGSSGYSNVGFFLNGGLLGNGGAAIAVMQSWRVH